MHLGTLILKGIMKKNFLILLILFCPFILSSQEGTSDFRSEYEVLSDFGRAESMFQDGLYDRCIDILEGLLKNSELSKREKALALELIAKAYLETDNPGKAESSVNLMLKNNPHYYLNEKDNSELFNRLVRKYKVHPRFSVGLRNTLDWMNYKTTGIFYLDGIHYKAPYTKELVGILNDFNWAYYGWAEVEFNGGISLNGDLIFKWTNFVREIETPDFSVTFKEQDNYIEIPLYLKKYFPVGENVLPYAAAGIGWLYMTSATANAVKDYPGNLPSETTGDISMLEARNRSTFEWLAGVGVGYKLKNLRIFVDFRYYRGMNSITNPEKGLINNTLSYDYLYIDNFVRFNQFEMGASFIYTFVNTVRRKK